MWKTPVWRQKERSHDLDGTPDFDHQARRPRVVAAEAQRLDQSSGGAGARLGTPIHDRKVDDDAVEVGEEKHPELAGIAEVEHQSCGIELLARAHTGNARRGRSSRQGAPGQR